jgi:hypothetical protein
MWMRLCTLAPSALLLFALVLPAIGRAASINLMRNWNVVTSVDAFHPPDTFAGEINYDTDTNQIHYAITEVVDPGAPGFDFFFGDSAYHQLTLAGAFSDQSFTTDDATYYSRSGTYTLGDDELSHVLAGDWYVVATSYYSTYATQLLPAPEPTELSFFALALALLLAFGPSFAARAQATDFVGPCQKAVGAKAGVDPASVKVRGKYKGQDGRIMLDFKLADGRVGVCRAQANATVEEVKLEEPKPAAN